MVIGIVSVVTEMKEGSLKEVGHHLHVPDPTLGSTLQFASVKAGIRGHGNWYCVCS